MSVLERSLGYKVKDLFMSELVVALRKETGRTMTGVADGVEIEVKLLCAEAIFFSAKFGDVERNLGIMKPVGKYHVVSDYLSIGTTSIDAIMNKTLREVLLQ